MVFVGRCFIRTFAGLLYVGSPLPLLVCRGERIAGVTSVRPSCDGRVTTASGGGQTDPEGRAGPLGALHLDRPAHRLGEALRDRETQPRAPLTPIAGAADAVKTLEDPRQIPRWNADSV